MRKIIIVIGFLITTFQIYAQEQRIVGGQEIDISEAPYQVAIVAVEPFTFDSVFCGGVILSCEWVLTSARMASITFIGDRVVAGSHDMSDFTAGQKVTIDQIIIHPDYEWNSMDHLPENDIALLHLATPLVFNDDVNQLNMLLLKIQHLKI